MVRFSDLSLPELAENNPILRHDTILGLEDRLQKECIQSVEV
jgi:hypothetical protein